VTRQSNGSLILPISGEPEDKSAFLNFSGKQVRIAWDHDKYIADQYENWLRAVQQDKSEQATGKAYTVKSIFEEWLKDSLNALDVRKRELRSQRNSDDLDNNTFQNAMMVAELAIEATRKFLEKPANKRLIGV